MSSLHHEILIHAPLNRVWDVITDLESVKHYNPLVESVQTISANKTGAGAARHCIFKDGKFAKERITAISPQNSVSMEMYEHEWPIAYMRWTTQISAQGDKVALVSDTEYAPGMGMFGKLLDAVLMKRQFHKVIGQTLEQMKAYIESNKHAG